MKLQTNRRQFVRWAAFSSMGYWAAGRSPAHGIPAPNERINIAMIGVGGYGYNNLKNIAGTGENIVALCDVDSRRAEKAFHEFPKARQYRDFRRMLDEGKNIDAVVISTPDHTHAAAAIMAMKMGKHVYCETPLAHSVYETRLMRETAAEHEKITQLGNQSTSFEGLRRAVDAIWGGAIGPVGEVHVWTDRPSWRSAVERPKESEPPASLDWDLWLGPAPSRHYSSDYLPIAWRGWWDFGTGAIGDMGCHTANLAFLALRLGYPTSVTARLVERLARNGFAAKSVIEFDFPARGKQPPVKLTWYDGVEQPPEKLFKTVGTPKAEQRQSKPPANGCLLVGERGMLYAPGESCVTFKLLPEGQFRDYVLPTGDLPKSPGHHREWLQAIRTSKQPMANFEYAAILTEALLLGNVALRRGEQKTLQWDGPNMRVRNLPEADRYIKGEYRKGWAL